MQKKVETILYKPVQIQEKENISVIVFFDFVQQLFAWEQFFHCYCERTLVNRNLAMVMKASKEQVSQAYNLTNDSTVELMPHMCISNSMLI